jgi:regulator of ribonuclease activity A
MTFKTADLCDTNADEVQVVLPGMQNFGGRSRFYGEMITIRAQGDFSQVREQVRSQGLGRVLVVDNNAAPGCAMLGDLLAAAALENGWQGVVVNGCIRDSADIAAMDLGVKALASVSARGNNEGAGEVNVELAFLGALFRPGEYLYSDEDGIILSAQELI